MACAYTVSADVAAHRCTPAPRSARSVRRSGASRRLVRIDRWTYRTSSELNDLAQAVRGARGDGPSVGVPHGVRSLVEARSVVYAGHAALAMFAKGVRPRISLALLVPVAFAPDW